MLFMRIIAVVTAILGLAGIVFGVLFVSQAASAQDEILASIAPLKLDQVNPTYDKVATQYTALKAAEEPKIQAGQAAPSASYTYLSAQRALLGLAKSNIGTTTFVRTSGIVTGILGIGLVLAGLLLFRKSQSAA
jgi:hypothetical protein